MDEARESDYLAGDSGIRQDSGSIDGFPGGNRRPLAFDYALPLAFAELVKMVPPCLGQTGIRFRLRRGGKGFRRQGVLLAP